MVVKRNIDGGSSGKLLKELGLDKSLVCHWAEHTGIKARLDWRQNDIREMLYALIKNEKNYLRKTNYDIN